MEDGAVVRRVCFGLGCTCDTFVYISVRNCSGFYVYNLTSIPSRHCYYGYCASTGFEEPTTSTTGKRSCLKYFIIMDAHLSVHKE